MGITIRQYKSSDYERLADFYKDKDTYGGEFNENRDSKEVVERTTSKDPFAVMVAEQDGEIVGTISIIENERVAWLYRFCVADSDQSDKIATMLYEQAEQILTKRGHRQVLVYTSPKSEKLHERYYKLGFIKGNDYSCFWKDI